MQVFAWALPATTTTASSATACSATEQRIKRHMFGRNNSQRNQVKEGPSFLYIYSWFTNLFLTNNKRKYFSIVLLSHSESYFTKMIWFCIPVHRLSKCVVSYQYDTTWHMCQKNNTTQHNTDNTQKKYFFLRVIELEVFIQTYDNWFSSKIIYKLCGSIFKAFMTSPLIWINLLV